MDEKSEQISKFNEYLNSLSEEELIAKNNEELDKNEEDFQALKSGLEQGKCSMCGNDLTHFSERKPCFHWLLWKAKGLKKKHFEILFNEKSFHQIDAYLRWVANSEVPLSNINDMVEEKASNKFIETTIKYQNLEWSFSCSHNDFKGHEGAHAGSTPHYHFQMKKDGNVVINYNGFHMPFTDYDDFCFAVEADSFDRLKARQIQGAGMQALFDNFPLEDLVDSLTSTDNEDTAQFHMGTMIIADPGTTISGDDIADMIEERKRTGASFAKLARNIPNAKVQTTITAGPGVPEIAERTKHKTRGK